MIYRKATKKELQKDPHCKAYAFKMAWYHWWVPVRLYSWIQSRYMDFDEMHELLEPGDQYEFMGIKTTYAGSGTKIDGLSKLFSEVTK